MSENQFTSSSLSLCVYCGSGPGKSPEYMAAAHTLGTSMASAGIGLVYGGGSIGLMGEVARTVIANGGNVTGIIPEFLVKRERMLDEGEHELIRVDDMHQRKMLMFERASGFVALPGGIGTLEELVEIATWAQLARHSKPIIIANIGDYWRPLLNLLSHMREEQFIREGLEVHFEVVDEAEAIVPAFLRQIELAGPPATDDENVTGKF
jgi:uncharacterized protein (TIGR00730 family)